MSRRSEWLLGGALVLLGLVLLGDSVDVYEIPSVWTFVPTVLIIWGLFSLIRHRLRELFWPSLLVLIGVLWQLVELEYLTSSEAWEFWPVVLVLLGVSMVLNRRRRSVSTVHGDSFEFLSVSSTVDRQLSGSLREGSATAVFGDVTVDLRNEDVAGPLEVDAVAVFGDVQLRVPEDWDVSTEAVGIFGSVADLRSDRPPRKSSPDLAVSGVAVFGDVLVTD